MANFDKSSRIRNRNTTEIVGTSSDDTITLSGTYLLAGTTAGEIDGELGSDVLVLGSAAPTGTIIAGIEATMIASSGS